MEKQNKNSKLTLVVTAGAAGLMIGIAWMYLFDIRVQPSAKYRAFLTRFYGQTPTPTATPSANAGLTADVLAQKVVPQSGITVQVKWGDLGVRLVQTGAIDMDKFGQNYKGEQYKEWLAYLTQNQDKGITINAQNSYFWVNTLWALGLVQKSDVLDKGIMMSQYKKDLGNFASTGGWTLGKRSATKLYSSVSLIPLTPEQQTKVAQIAAGIYRPCCDNSTAFPDCNHGMAILGLIELMVSQGATDEEVYKAALAFNSYWFSQTYIDLAYYFKTKENLDWDKVDAKRVLSAQFSSSSGYRQIKENVGAVPGTPQGGSSCGA